MLVSFGKTWLKFTRMLHCSIGTSKTASLVLKQKLCIEILDSEDTCPSGKGAGCSREFAGASLVQRFLDEIKPKLWQH